MLLEKGRISNFQLGFLLIGFMYGSSAIIPPGGGAGHDAWITVALGVLEGLLIAWIFTSLARRFKNKTIVEINDLVYGRFLGKCISLLFIWYLFHLGALVMNNYDRFFHTELYPNSPHFIGLLFFMLVCASTVNRGIEVLARCSLVLVPITILILFFDTFLLIPHIDFHNLLPILDVPMDKLLWAAHGTASFPLAETVAFLMVLAFVDKSEKGPLVASRSLLITGLVGIMIVGRNTAVLGPMTEVYNYPSYMATQVIDVGDVITRIEALVAINLITMGFIKVSVLYYGTVLGLAQVFNLRSYRPLILPIGLLMLILTLTNVGNTSEMYEFARKGYPIYSIPFQIVIPLLTLAVAKLRRLPAKGDDKL